MLFLNKRNSFLKLQVFHVSYVQLEVHACIILKQESSYFNLQSYEKFSFDSTPKDFQHCIAFKSP